MLYWECKRRLKGVREFRGLVRIYFSNIHYFSPLHSPKEEREAKEARHEINARMGDVIFSCNLMGYPLTVSSSRAGNLNLLANLFNLWRFQISASVVTDNLDRVIGDYERTSHRLFWQVFNPFFWLNWLLLKIIRIPFQILGAAGFDSSKIENSAGGRTVKAISGTIVSLSALLTALQVLGWLEPIKRFLRALLKGL